MTDTTSPIPTDTFSIELRKLNDNPGALSAQSTIRTQDFYGNLVTWVLETFRNDDNEETLFLIVSAPTGGGQHLVIPHTVLNTLARHRDQLSTRVRRRSGHRLIALRKERGDKLGNPEALRKARARRKKGGAR